MIGIYAEVCYAHFREENAYSILLTKGYPPPFTIYGFGLSLCGSFDYSAYKGCRVGLTAVNGGALNSHLIKAHNLRKKNVEDGERVICPKRREFLFDYKCILWFDGPEIEADLRRSLTGDSRTRCGILCLGDNGGVLEDIRLVETQADLSMLQHKFADGKFARLVPDPDGRECLCVWFNGEQGDQYDDWAKWEHALGRYEKVSELTFPKVDELFEVGPVEQSCAVFEFVQDM
jgi:hypothetical protein